MEKFKLLRGVTAPLPMINVDTDMIIPKDYMKTITRSGLGIGLFAEMRYRDDGSLNPDFVLNKPAYRNTEILITGDNFGCGSSREHAPWALLDFGIRCVISTSFAEIFYGNCFQNGILPIVLRSLEHKRLLTAAECGFNSVMSIDLEAGVITAPDGGCTPFEVDAFRRDCLLNGLDHVALTLNQRAAIDRFEESAIQIRPWLR